MSNEKMKENPLGDESEEKAPASTCVCTWHINDTNITQPTDCCLLSGLSLRMWAIGGQITRSSSNEELLGAKVLGAVHDKQGEVNNLHHDQFRERIELWRRLSYPHLLTLYGTTPDVFVLEHAQAFRTYVAERSNYTRVFRVLYEVLLAMLYLHERGFAHGAVDLDHIVIGDDQKAKLIMGFKSISGYEPEADPPTTGQRSVFRDDELQFLKCVEEAIKYANARRLAKAHGVNVGCEVQTASEHVDVKKAYCDKLTPMEQLTADWDPDVHKKACQFIGNLYKKSDEQEAPTQLFSSLDEKLKIWPAMRAREFTRRKIAREIFIFAPNFVETDIQWRRSHHGSVLASTSKSFSAASTSGSKQIMGSSGRPDRPPCAERAHFDQFENTPHKSRPYLTCKYCTQAYEADPASVPQPKVIWRRKENLEMHLKSCEYFDEQHFYRWVSETVAQFERFVASARSLTVFAGPRPDRSRSLRISIEGSAESTNKKLYGNIVLEPNQELASSGTHDAQLTSEQAVAASIESALLPWFSRTVLKFDGNIDTAVVILAQFMRRTSRRRSGPLRVLLAPLE